MSWGRKVEKWYPYTVAALSALGWYYLFKWLNLTKQEAKELFITILNVSAIAAGFLGTAASILLTMNSGSSVIKDLQQSGSLKLLYSYVISAIRHQFWLVLFSVILLLIYPRLDSPKILNALGMAWGVSAVLAGISSVRIIQLFGRIVTAD